MIIKHFAWLKEITKVREETIINNSINDVNKLKNFIVKRHPKLKKHINNNLIRIAVNHTYTYTNDNLNPKDEIIEGSEKFSSLELIEGRDSRIFLFEPTEAAIVRMTLIIINNVAINAVSLDNKFAEPLADIMPPIPPPPPRPKPSLSVP